MAADHIHEYIYNDVFPGDTASTSSTDSSDSGSTDTSNEPLGGVDYDEPPTAPATTDDTSSSDSNVDPASLAEEGGRYDPATGDYYDSDGDRYYLDDSGNRVYY